jgi:hypothetical protein
LAALPFPQKNAFPPHLKIYSFQKKLKRNFLDFAEFLLYNRPYFWMANRPFQSGAFEALGMGSAAIEALGLGSAKIEARK